MKRLFSIFILLATALAVHSQKSQPDVTGNVDDQTARPAQSKFQILVTNEKEKSVILQTNRELRAMQDSSRVEASRGLLGDLLWKGFTSAFKQKTINATSNLASMGIDYFSEALKSKREKWYRKATQQCSFTKSLSSETQINDFYALPSVKGAMDPENLKFQGFGCKNYIEVLDGSKEGVGVFYVFCKMRRDSIGLSHIVNHSKFMVEIDSLVFNPKYCSLPHDSTGRNTTRFDFSKRDNLTLELQARFYSSWINQATMITNDQLLGEFTINVSIDKSKLNADGFFIYDKNDPDYEDLVSVYGDCYIVPRSYTGTIDGTSFTQSWGTGQYRIEMEVSENCSIVDSYYQIREAGNGEAVAFANATPGKKKWDKAKWKVEWNAMKGRRKGTPLLKNVWNCIVSAYKGTGWMATFTDPATTALYTWEAQKLDEWIDDVHDDLFPEKNKDVESDSDTKDVPTGILEPTVPPEGVENPHNGVPHNEPLRQ